MLTPNRLAVLCCSLFLAVPLTGATRPGPTPEATLRAAIAGSEFCVFVEGVKQGKFKGESTIAMCKDGIKGMAFDSDVTSPRDAASGLPNGKRQYKPLTFTKEWGAASPQLFQALTSNEALKTVRFEFIKADAAGKESIFQRITLTNASVSEIRRYIGTVTPAGSSVGTGAPGIARALEDVSFTFASITLEDTEGKTMVSDNWKAAP
jgi:type VI secretion system secreted protein Hcp